MKMLHVTIRTSKFEDEIRFYQEVVGLSIINDLRGSGHDIVFLADHKGETCVELIDHPKADHAGNDNLSIGFRTYDVVKMKEDLEAKGYETSPMISPNPRVKFFFVTDPAGVRIQFM